jgi:hypothetical protein
MAFHKAGNLFVANLSDNTIERFTPGGVGSLFASTGSHSPAGIAFDGAGNLYVTNTDDGSIDRYTPGGPGSPFNDGALGPANFLAFQPTSIPEPASITMLGCGITVLLIGYARRNDKGFRVVFN